MMKVKTKSGRVFPFVTRIEVTKRGSQKRFDRITLYGYLTAAERKITALYSTFRFRLIDVD